VLEDGHANAGDALRLYKLFQEKFQHEHSGPLKDYVSYQRQTASLWLRPICPRMSPIRWRSEAQFWESQRNQ
jgi:hypothetical protein